MKTRTKKWGKDDLLFPYIEALYGLSCLKINEEQACHVIGDTSIGSFKMQTANFRFLLNTEGWQLDDASKAMKQMVDDLANKTKTDIMRLAKQVIRDRGFSDEIKTAVEHNEMVNRRKVRLNKMLESNYQAKLKMLRRRRKLVRKNA